MISSHDYARPSEYDVLEALSDVFGGRQGELIWEKVCLRSGASRQGGGLSLDGLELAVEYLKRWPGLAGIVGRSVGVRIRAFRSLRARTSSAPA